MASYLETDIPAIQRRVVDHVEYTLARDRTNFDKFSAYMVPTYIYGNLDCKGDGL